MVSVCSTILKRCFASYGDQSLYNNYSKLANKYNKLKENKEKKIASDNQEKLREDVKKWFFSQTLENRMKICAVENELYGKILYQMIIYYKMDKTMQFKPKPSFFGDDEDNNDQFSSNINNYNSKAEEGMICPAINTNIKLTRTSKSGKKIEAPKLGYSQSSLNDFKEEEIISNNFANYFTFQSYRGGFSLNGSNNCSNDYEVQKMIEESTEYLFKNIFFFSVHHKYFPDCFTLSPEFLLEKDKFENCFKILGNHNYFCSLIKAKQINNSNNKMPKHYTFNMPDWFKNNNNKINDNECLHSVTQYAIAFFEQVIMIKYLLNNNDQNLKTYSLLNEQALNRFFDERKTAINYLKKHYNNENKINILKELEIENNYKNLMLNKDKMKYVNYFNNICKRVNRDDKFKNNPYVIENILENPYSNKSEEKYNKMKNIQKPKNSNKNYYNGELTLDEIINKITNLLKINYINFIDYMLFQNYICLWKSEYFLQAELFEKLLNLIAEQSLKELISDSKKTKSGKSRHRKKNKKNHNNNAQQAQKEEEKNNKIQNEYEGIFKDEDEELYAPYYLKANTEQKKIYLKLKGFNKYDNSEKEEIRQFIYNEILLGIIIDNVFLTPLNSGLDFNVEIKNEDINMFHNDENKIYIKEKEEEKFENIKKKNMDEKIEKKEIDNNKIEEEKMDQNILIEDSPNKIDIIKNDSSTKEAHISNISKELNLESNDSLSIKSSNLSSEIEIEKSTTMNTNDTNNYTNENTIKSDDNYNNSNNKKKKKEQTFFLFDTRKKKKKKNVHNQNNNTLVSNEFSLIVIKEPNRRLPFFDKLHNDIIKYETKVVQLLNYGMKFKDYCIKEIKRIIEETFSFSKDYNVDVYGSYATGLMIEASDIDIKIKLNSGSRSDLDNFFESLCKKLENENKFDKINPIGTASVPVIKLLLSSEKFIRGKDDLENSFKQYKELSLFKHYIFDINELTKIKIDVTFICTNDNKGNITNNDINEKNIENNNSINNNKFDVINNETAHDHDKSMGGEISSVAYVKEQIVKYPEVKFILRVLKRYFYYKKMNTSFLGGLSSYNLFLLLLSYAKFMRISPNPNSEIIENIDKNSKINLGYFLFNFLYFFKCLNFSQCIIDINSPNIYDIYDIVIPDKAKEYNFGKSIVIIDPLTGVNASKSSYKIEEIQNTFSEAFDFFQNEKIKYDKEGKTKVSKNTNNNKDILMGLPISNKNDNNHGGGNIIEKFLGK